VSVRKFSTASILSPSYKSSKIWDGTTLPGYFESIATVVVSSSGTSNITFSNIPQNYTHLQIRGILRTNAGGNLVLQFNGDTGANYSYHSLTGEGSGTPGANYGSSTTELVLSRSGGIASASSTFSSYIIDVLDYSNTSKYKSVKSLSGFDANGSGNIALESGSWRSSNAITSINFNRPTFQQFSTLALYGIRSI
jgi:hypothetical protein